MKAKQNKKEEVQTRQMTEKERINLDRVFSIEPDRILNFRKECEEDITEYFMNRVDWHSYNIFTNTERTANMSVIEKLFIMAFECRNITQSIESEIKLIYQPEIKCKSGKKYYADFCFEFITNYEVKFKHLGLLIELDGHIWHEKSPEQVEKDKIRERELIDNGYTLLRFSGREVYRSPFKVVEECVRKYFNLVERSANG